MPQDYDRTVILHIPAERAAQNRRGEGIAEPGVHTIDVDTRGPEVDDAEGRRRRSRHRSSTKISMRTYVPSASDFSGVLLQDRHVPHQAGIRGRAFGGRDVPALEGPVERGDEVSVFYDDRGNNAARDAVGNLAPGFDLVARNLTGTTTHRGPRGAAQPHGGGRRPRRDRPGLGSDRVRTAGARITGYLIEVSADAGSTWSNLVRNTRNTDTSYRHDRVSPGASRATTGCRRSTSTGREILRTWPTPPRTT